MTTSSRLLLELHKTITDVNRSTINPRITELKMTDLVPVIQMVANARAEYLDEVFKLTTTLKGQAPSTDQLKHLRHLRLTFEELAFGSQALETAIERGYIDVQ